jgi:hypothetical protein
VTNMMTNILITKKEQTFEETIMIEELGNVGCKHIYFYFHRYNQGAEERLKEKKKLSELH